MGYRIEYGPRKRRGNVIWILAAICLLASLLVPRTTLERWLLPGDAEVTKAALGQMLEAMRQGTPAGEAVTAFCQSIVRGAAGG